MKSMLQLALSLKSTYFCLSLNVHFFVLNCATILRAQFPSYRLLIHREEVQSQQCPNVLPKQWVWSPEQSHKTRSSLTKQSILKD